MPDTPRPSSEPPPPRPRRRLQFGLGAMLLAVLPVSVLTAAWAGMMGLGAHNPAFPQGFYVLMAAAAPMGLVIAVSVGRSAVRLVRRARRRR